MSTELYTAIGGMLDILSHSMYESHETAPGELDAEGEYASSPIYESFCKKCHVIADGHPIDTDCQVGQTEHYLHQLQSKER